MVHHCFDKDEDQKLFIRLVRSGLKEAQAIEQMKMLGISPRIPNPFFDEGNRVGNKLKVKFPHYHHKRRW